MNYRSPILNDEPIEFAPGDVFFGLDLNHHVPRVHSLFLNNMCKEGVLVYFMVYDLLPVQFPHFWEPQHNVDLVVHEWLSVVSSLSGVVCISKAVADDFSAWINKNIDVRQNKIKVDWFHLGGDIDHSQPSRGRPDDAEKVLAKLKSSPTFLMVGTLEPRKGHIQVLEAFEGLWAADQNINLVIVGKKGWMVDDLVHKLQNHVELDKRLFWLAGISDEYLEQVYCASTCLIAASYGEGFGLPLIEAAQHKLSIIARDIPVFREVGGDFAYYYKAQDPAELAQSIEKWLSLYALRLHPKSDNMPWLTWKESAAHLLKALRLPTPIELNQNDMRVH
jgi:glycosyltransferase involved in cell wall biosynthesis